MFLWVCGVLITIGSLRLHVGTFENPGMGLFPLLTGILLGLLSGGLFIRCLLKRPSEREEPFWGRERQWWKVISTVLVMVLYAVTMDRLGFLFVTFLLLLFLFKAIGTLNWKISLAGAILTSSISHLLFKVLLNVQLPIGPWGI
jgi:hypothetical protein